MDKIKLSLFDIFAYMLPGFIVFLSLGLLMYNSQSTFIETFDAVRTTVKNADGNSIILVLVLSYLFGFVLHFFGFLYFHFTVKRIWKKKLRGVEMSLSSLKEEYVLIRHLSKGNAAWVETSNYLRAMCINLSLSFLILTAVIVKNVVSNRTFSFDWIMLIAASLTTAAVMLREAVKFHVWSFEALKETVKVLKLKEHVAKGEIKENS